MKGDVIRLQFPARPDYILAIRLAVSAVAQRTGFDVEDIEDLKVASAEACGLLLAHAPDMLVVSLQVESGLSLLFEAAGQGAAVKKKDEDSALSQYLLDALADSCEITQDGDAVTSVKLYKKLSC